MFSRLTVALLLGGLPGIVLATPITITTAEYGINVSVQGGAAGFAEDISNTLSLNTAFNLSATVGGSSGDAQVSITSDSQDASIAATYQQQRDVPFHSYSQYFGSVYFTAEADGRYDLSGYSSLFGTSRLLYAVRLFDLTASTWLLQSEQVSDGVTDKTFDLGVASGNTINVLNGSLTGDLVAGREYRFWWNSYIQAFPGNAPAATGAGSLTLDVSAVPEPGSVFLASLGMLGLLSRRFGPHG